MASDPYAGLADLDSELAVLGSCMWAEDFWEKAVAHVDARDFHWPGHARLFEACCTAWNSGARPATFVGLHLPLIMGKDLDTTLILDASMRTTAEVNIRARHVADLAARRRMLNAGREIAETARSGGSVDEALDELVSRVRHRRPLEDADPDVGAFLADDDAEDWLVPGFLERGERVILTGEEGWGKSTVLRQVAVQAAAGVRPFLTIPDGQPLRVMIVDAENSAGAIRRQLRPMVERAGPGFVSARLVVLSRPGGLDLLHESDQRWLEGRIVANRPDLVVIGPLYKLHSGDPNEQQPAATLRDLFDRLRTRHGFALLLEAHQPYAGTTGKRPLRPYGASLWSRWPELGLALEKGADYWKLTPWRGAREERPGWPRALVRAQEWPWLAAEPKSRHDPDPPPRTDLG